MTVMLLTSCNWENPSEAEKNPLSSNGNPWGKSWFSGDKEYQFISTEKGKFIRYLPDSLETSFYFEVIEELESLKTVTVKTLYSDDRAIASIEYDSNNMKVLNIRYFN